MTGGILLVWETDTGLGPSAIAATAVGPRVVGILHLQTLWSTVLKLS